MTALDIGIASPDAVLAGMVAEIEFSYLSSFARPVVARSVCIFRASEIERRSCPDFTNIYVRDLYDQMRRDFLRPVCMRRQMAANHPCKAISVRECTKSYVEATATPR